ncbi:MULTISPECIES: hypothetical protein [unclassified Cupriavidus]|uniref:hypothetical protein n=1 Tax=unclassified Cupriavidus TaxID=2640874 RepID=UPI001C0025B6|nr:MULTISPECIES: hypothetical protein [unclassified Cupriavidus]MCA3186567.1 hypothetical protein [Cupriavidus sp.]MCA3191668.1 hypothetical protein [Cupriavidus sp.]MCA3200338.1 hypothetical protein [Cupriavidus sp.]MCA3233186.1 hypothetical protein [Cupriavidus sp.]QWE93330.1 hypothetical protein KLP38_09785 [Cupriavidus sp. EM10]
MADADWIDHVEFFANVGDDFLYPKSHGEHGECIWPVSIEMLYQMFKERMEAERTATGESDGRGI